STVYVGYARGGAFTARKSCEETSDTFDNVTAIARDFPYVDNGTALRIAVEALKGEIAMRSGRMPAAIAAFRAAVALEDGLAYTEPPTWYYPMRHSLGLALLKAGQLAEAERV